MPGVPSFDPHAAQGGGPKEPAPGAKTAKVCGILAIVLALTCVGIPIALILGIVAIVKAAKARGLARSYPETYEHPGAGGLVLGIVGLCLPVVMLPFAGIVSAIAVPALLAQRQHARDGALLAEWSQVQVRAQALAAESQASGGNPLTGEEAIQRLMEDPALRALKNSVAPGEPVLIRGTEPRPGAIALSPGVEETPAGTAHSLTLRASFGLPQSGALREEKIELGTVLRAPVIGIPPEPPPPPGP